MKGRYNTMAKATKKNQAIMKTMAPALGLSLLAVSRAVNDIAVNADMEEKRVKVWETSVHFDARIKAGRAKDADDRAKQDAQELREQRKAFIATLPYAGNIRKANSDITRAISDFIGAKNDKRALAVDRAYDAYVRETTAMSVARLDTTDAVADLLHVCVKTDAVNERLIACRIVPCLGACKAGKSDIKAGNKSGIRVMKRAEFVRMVMLCMYSIAQTGKCSDLYTA